MNYGHGSDKLKTGYAPPPGPPPTQFGSNGPPPPYGYPGQGHGGYPNQGQSYNQYGSPPPGGWPGRSAGPLPMAPPEGNQTFGPPTAGGNQRFYRYSQCNGKKKALCIGINYIGQEGQLGGCINDALNMRNFLCRHYGYKMEDIVLLRDDSQNPQELPTKENMLRAMQWLVRDPRPNDSLFFHYSGHGGQTQDLNGDEDDGSDEVIYPVDYKKQGHIVDDDLHNIMVKPLPPGCRLTAIFDSCHSGTALDLPYVYSTEGKIKEPNLMAEAGKDALAVFTAYERRNILGAVKGAMDLVKVATGNTRQAQAQRMTRQTKTSPADAISWGGCKDSQTSADTQEAGRATGAMSYAFITALEQNPQQTYQQLLVNIRNILVAKYSQKPQLSCSHPMDTNILFIC